MHNYLSKNVLIEKFSLLKSKGNLQMIIFFVWFAYIFYAKEIFFIWWNINLFYLNYPLIKLYIYYINILKKWGAKAKVINKNKYQESLKKPVFMSYWI